MRKFMAFKSHVTVMLVVCLRPTSILGCTPNHRFTNQSSAVPARIFLLLAGLLYLALAVYCTVRPQAAAETVHLAPEGAGGQSEFLVIYGGLELAMAVLFILPVFGLYPQRPALITFLVIHGLLVSFRTVSFFLYGPLPSSTTKLAIGEWVLFIGGLLLLWLG